LEVVEATKAVQINQPNRLHQIPIHSIYVLTPTPATRLVVLRQQQQLQVLYYGRSQECKLLLPGTFYRQRYVDFVQTFDLNIP
jgi:hypothetical protein